MKLIVLLLSLFSFSMFLIAEEIPDIVSFSYNGSQYSSWVKRVPFTKEIVFGDTTIKNEGYKIQVHVSHANENRLAWEKFYAKPSFVGTSDNLLFDIIFDETVGKLVVSYALESEPAFEMKLIDLESEVENIPQKVTTTEITRVSGGTIEQNPFFIGDPISKLNVKKLGLNYVVEIKTNKKAQKKFSYALKDDKFQRTQE